MFIRSFSLQISFLCLFLLNSGNYFSFFLFQLEDAFNRFGRIRKVWVARRPPGFAFVEFEDARDADDAVKALDGS